MVLKICSIKFNYVLFFFITSCFFCQSQTGTSVTGLWTQYMYKKALNNDWAVAGDFQYRTYEVGKDFQQFIARAAVSYRPAKIAIEFQAGYGYFTGQSFSAGDSTTSEHRIHQDLWFASNVSNRFELKHRLRIEERFIENQDFRSRWRYTLFFNVPLNNKTIIDHTLYAALWNEIFINGQTDTGIGTVEYFDRNWAFAGLGYKLNSAIKFQAGYMREVTPAISKGQLILTVFHSL
ncbi:DUF2490 domain-containing protein [uncultured Nonlabens sp.]|uniref:DUF2490 domain-containing protein n=1 Tax=uncultured Nonlabens sp. TaxID=859306 RepID=UPI00260543E1|nr:DUF2490 domain-containing protein [uncultured Nonlabens sp.]